MPFRDIHRHRRLIALVARAVARASLPPSLIFAGPDQAAARQAAMALAQALNCTDLKPPTSGLPLDACGACAACTRIARLVHPDVLVVEPGDSGSIKIEQIRDAIDRAGYRPFEGRRRVVIVAQADALVPAAQNALLKTLEEPPPSSVFILLTARPDTLLSTVRSRCIRLTFAGTEDEAVDEEARGVAERVLAHAAATRQATQRIEGAKQLLAHTGAGGVRDREQLAAYLHAMASLLRDVEVLAAGADAGMLANADARPTLERLAADYGGDRGARAFAIVDRALVALDRNASPKIVADWVVLEL